MMVFIAQALGVIAFPIVLYIGGFWLSKVYLFISQSLFRATDPKDMP